MFRSPRGGHYESPRAQRAIVGNSSRTCRATPRVETVSPENPWAILRQQPDERALPAFARQQDRQLRRARMQFVAEGAAADIRQAAIYHQQTNRAPVGGNRTRHSAPLRAWCTVKGPPL